MISLHELSHTYPNGHKALSGINLEIQDGETLALIGRSGCGKSTLLKTINGLVRPRHGTITINGSVIDYQQITKLRRHIGYVIQHIGLFPHLTIAKNIDLVPTLEGWTPEQCRERREYLLAMVGLDPARFTDKYPRQLSGGEQQRVGLTRALMLNPPILLMDEPFGALDPIIRSQLQHEFTQLEALAGKTIVMVTHDMREAMRLGDRIAIMDAGRIVQIGSPNELRHEPGNEFVANFVKSGLGLSATPEVANG